MAETKEKESEAPKRGRPPKSSYDADKHGAEIHAALVEASQEEDGSSVTSTSALAVEARNFHEAYWPQAWYKLLLKVAKES
jgi:hypothetical protein